MLNPPINNDHQLPPPANHDHLTHPKYRPDIDGLRAVAILSVVGFHAFPNWVHGGFVGVDIFFVISGYLISTIIMGSLERNSFSFVEFYIRRINRIFPALLLVLITCFAFGWFALLADEYKQLGKHIAGGAGFVSNFLFWNESGYFDNAAETKPLLHLWSLGVEEQFYIIWPLLLWLAWKQRLNLLTIAIVVGIISFALNIGKVHSDTVAAFYSPQTRFWELMAGSILAYMTRHNQDIFPKFKHRLDTWLGIIVYAQAPEANGKTLRNVQSVFGSVLIAIGILFITKERHFPGWWALLPILGAVLIISAGAQAWVNRVVLSNRMLVWFGLISFPLYLWHWPLLSFARILEGETPSREIRIAAVLISIVLAWLTYRLIEQPIRFGKYSKVTIITLVFLMTLVGFAGYNTYQRKGFTSRQVVINNVDPNQNIPTQSNEPSPCTTESKYALISTYCTKFVANNSQKTIVLWGDSSTGAWQFVFRDIAKEKNYTLILISHPRCSPLLDAANLNPSDVEGLPYCSYGIMQGQAMELIKSFKPNMTVVIAGWNWLNDQCTNEEKTHPARISRPLDKRVRETINELDKISELIIFRSWPLLPKEPNYEISRIPFLQKKSGMTFVDVNDFNKENRCINEIFDSDPTARTVFFSPSEKICSDKCVSVLDGIKMYQDGYHITPQGSMQFRNEIEKLLE